MTCTEQTGLINWGSSILQSPWANGCLFYMRGWIHTHAQLDTFINECELGASGVCIPNKMCVRLSVPHTPKQWLLPLYRNSVMDGRSMQWCILSMVPSILGQSMEQTGRGLVYHIDPNAGQHSRQMQVNRRLLLLNIHSSVQWQAAYKLAERQSLVLNTCFTKITGMWEKLRSAGGMDVQWWCWLWVRGGVLLSSLNDLTTVSLKPTQSMSAKPIWIHNIHCKWHNIIIVWTSDGHCTV